MAETVRLADVAETIVQRYLYEVVSRLVDSDVPEDAWFRMIAQPSPLDMENHTDQITVEPVFEVLVVMPGAVSNLAAVLSEVAAGLPGRVRVMPRATTKEAYTKEFLSETGWMQTAVPAMRGQTPELVH